MAERKTIPSDNEETGDGQRSGKIWRPFSKDFSSLQLCIFAEKKRLSGGKKLTVREKNNRQIGRTNLGRYKM